MNRHQDPSLSINYENKAKICFCICYEFIKTYLFHNQLLSDQSEGFLLNKNNSFKVLKLYTERGYLINIVINFALLQSLSQVQVILEIKGHIKIIVP